MGLKKQFSENDIKRMRNIISGKNNDKTTDYVGYSKKSEFHKEGDVWEDGDKTWTIKDGVKQSISSLEHLRNEIVTPLFCPNCKKIMNKRNDKTFYKTHRICFDCVVEMEHNIRKEGRWEEYQKDIKNSEIDRHIEEFKTFIEEQRNKSGKDFVTEDGDVERWIGKIDQERVDDYVKETVDFLENLKQ